MKWSPEVKKAPDFFMALSKSAHITVGWRPLNLNKNRQFHAHFPETPILKFGPYELALGNGRRVYSFKFRSPLEQMDSSKYSYFLRRLRPSYSTFQPWRIKQYGRSCVCVGVFVCAHFLLRDRAVLLQSFAILRL